jgi:YD repeat-containing protein
MITTCTYKPLVGITSLTDPRGDIITYTYDDFGRLEFVKDKDNKVLSESQYNYKQ